jgi:excisionase family DNA binding protein
MPAPKTRRARPRKHYDPPSPGRWVLIPEAAAYCQDRFNRPVSARTMRRWIADGVVPAYKVGPRRVQVNLDDIDALPEPVPAPLLSEADEQLAREVVAVLLPLSDEQRERLSLLLHPGRGRRGAA